MKRKFYIIAHNPDTVDDAIAALKEGANALGPDIAFDDGELWVYHRTALTPSHGEGDPTLKEYCQGLARFLLANPAHGLALIAWDMKNVEDPGFDFQKVRDIIQTDFLDVLAAAKAKPVAMLFTHADNHDYLLKEVRPHMVSNWGFGLDQHDSPTEVDAIFNGNGFSYCYADGTSFFAGNTMNYLEQVKVAIALRDGGNSFSFVYGWTVNSEAKLAAYLDAGVDGIITDEIVRLRSMIDGKYADRFELATVYDDSFGADAQLPLS